MTAGLGSSNSHGDLTVTGSMPDGVELLGIMDRQLSEVVTKIRGQSLGAYRQAAPGRVAGGVKLRRVSKHGQRLVIKIAKVPLGGKVSGRDVGAQAVAYWTNYGTKGPIRLEKPVRLPNGRIVRQVRGQRAQHWVQEARRQADAHAVVLMEQELDDQVRAAIGRVLPS